MYCAQCGGEIADGGKFCSKCGTPVAASGIPVMNVEASGVLAMNVEASGTGRNSQGRRTRKKLVLLASLAVIICVISAVAGMLIWKKAV